MILTQLFCVFLLVNRQNLAPSTVFCAPLNWEVMLQPLCFYWHEKAPMANSPAYLAADANATCAPPRSNHNICNMGLQVHPVFSLLGHHFETVRHQPHQKIDRSPRNTSHQQHRTKLFLLGRELIFYRPHQASSDISQE